MGGRGSSSGSNIYGPEKLRKYQTNTKGLENLPELQGSEKQKSWAEDIRRISFESLDVLTGNILIEGRSKMEVDGKIQDKLYYRKMTPEVKSQLSAVKHVKEVLKSYYGDTSSAGEIIGGRYFLNPDAVEGYVKNITSHIAGGANLESPSETAKVLKKRINSLR